MHCMLHDAAREQGASNDWETDDALYTELLRSSCSGRVKAWPPSAGHELIRRTTGKRLTLFVTRLALRMPCAIHFRRAMSEAETLARPCSEHPHLQELSMSAVQNDTVPPAQAEVL